MQGQRRTPQNFLNTYRPLIRNRFGREAVTRHALPPFVDASCRREPDFESNYPSISALCRTNRFAPRLSPGDRVVYLTTRGRYLGEMETHWRLVAVLRVLHRFESHDEAAVWYRGRNLPLPSNCMVEDNPPLPLSMTAGTSPQDKFGSDPEFIIRKWNLDYRQRARANGVFLATEPLFLDLFDPPIVSEATMRYVFGRIPGTQTPPSISDAELEQLLLATGLSEILSK